MTKITTLDLNPFYRNAIGVDQLFNRIINQIDHHSNDSTNYPPYNIIKTGEDTFEVQVATAGFDVAVAGQIGYLKTLPLFFLEFDLLLQSRSKELILDFSTRRWFFGAGLFPL
jgi:hypothetical protein